MVKTSKEQQVEDEKRILAELQKNSDESLDAIAKKCGLSRQKVFKVIKNLERAHAIWGYTAVVDEQVQGLQKFMILVKRSVHPVEYKTVDAIALSKLEPLYKPLGIMVESSYFLHGEYDWGLVFTAEDIRHATKFRMFLLEHFSGMITKTILMQVLFTQREHFIINPHPAKLHDLF